VDSANSRVDRSQVTRSWVPFPLRGEFMTALREAHQTVGSPDLHKKRRAMRGACPRGRLPLGRLLGLISGRDVQSLVRISGKAGRSSLAAIVDGGEGRTGATLVRRARPFWGLPVGETTAVRSY